MKNFTATVQGRTFEDRALFEEAALAYRATRKAVAPRGAKADWNPVKGEAETLQRAIRRGWKAPALKAEGREFAPVGHEIGASRTLAIGADLVEGQVWSEAPEGGLWIATDRGFFWVRKSDGAAYDGLPTPGGYVGASIAEIAA